MAWQHVRSQENRHVAMQAEVMRCVSEESEERGGSLSEVIKKRDNARQELIRAYHQLVETLTEQRQETLKVFATSLEQFACSAGNLLDYLRRGGSVALPGPDEPEDGLASQSSLSSEHLRTQAEGATSRVSQWVQGVCARLTAARQEREEQAQVYAEGLRRLSCLLDGSDSDLSVEEATKLERSLPEVHMALESMYLSEEEVWSDQSLIHSFPMRDLVEVLQMSCAWGQEVLFNLDQMCKVESVKAKVVELEGLHDPEELLERRTELKKARDDAEDELLDLRTPLEKLQRRRLSTQELEEKIEKVRKQLLLAVKELEVQEDRLWRLLHFYPEYTRHLKEAVEGESVGLPASYEKFDMFEVVERLSQAGHMGNRHNVFRVRQGEEEFVIKEYSLMEGQRTRKRFMLEASILHRLEHPYLVRLSSAFVEERHEHGVMTVKGYLKMPLYVGGSLWSWMLRAKPSKQQKHRVLAQILQGMEHLRQNRIIHCDIKPANILMTSNHERAEPKIADFDVSREQEDHTRDLIATVTATQVVGTLTYMAPELVDPTMAKRRASHKSDMYSYGLVVAEFLTETARQEGTRDMRGMIGALEDEARDLVVKLLDADPRMRPSAAEALTHPYFNHSMILEREQVEKQRKELREQHDSELAKVLSQQEELARQEREVDLQRQRVHEEEKQLLHQQRQLMARGEQLESEALSRKLQLQKEKAEITQKENQLRSQQKKLVSELKTLSRQEAELDLKAKDVEAEKLLLADDRAQFHPPVYWQRVNLHGPVSVRVKVDVTREWKDRVQELMTSTCIQQYIGQGRDNQGLTHKGYRVERVFHIQDRSLWLPFAVQRKNASRWIMESRRSRPKTKVSTWRDWMKRELLQDKTSNEVFLFHGTRQNVVDAILSCGLDERVCSMGGLFGAGIYLAENSSKSDEYCVPDARGICSMFLVRAVLGMPYEAEHPMPNTRLPPASADSRPHDSVIGVTRSTHPSAFLHKYREFIVYDRRQTYPEFLIEFRRV
mmetsp:Transcript_31851/g.101631  ORF Transcript_31851/g.101631 Transcript_31851/m.101631 type:complete len:1006 (-) Transcript_31851:99-3116(-)